MPAPTQPAPVDAPGEMNPAVSAPLDPATPTETPDVEPPLSAEEQAELAGFDGLVRATDWNVPAAPSITDVTVARAYLDWKERFFKSCDDGSVYVLKNDYTGSEQVASEGIAYGMLLAVGVGDRTTFDGLWRYYREHRNGNGLMNWLYAPCGGQLGGNGASDADLDAAMALILANDRWADYEQDARDLVAAIGTHETQICGDGRIVLKPGDAWGGCDGTVNPSYFSPAYYRRFALLQTDRADFWNQFASDTYDMLDGMQEQVGGLLPDWGFGDGRAEGGDRGQYGYEAVRAPWRIALDLAWSGDEAPRAVLTRMSETIDARGGLTAMADDESFEDKRNSAFLGSLSLSGVGVSQAKFDGYVAEWKAYEELDDQWYYQASLRVLFLMVAGGFFPVSY
ncbi:MAG TPA: glycosyl hydrolase family 8 [Polyangiaceae bacterium]|nr:glycosyl hydrolase family 8 [Polyangiaceae bacterium]